MRKWTLNIAFGLTALIVGCNSDEDVKNKIIGEWVNNEEMSTIMFKRDYIFESSNLPLDVQNKYYLTFDKNIKKWEGRWSVEKNVIKLDMNGSYYYINVHKPIIGELRLNLRLLEESGGDVIYFDKKQ